MPSSLYGLRGERLAGLAADPPVPSLRLPNIPRCTALSNSSTPKPTIINTALWMSLADGACAHTTTCLIYVDRYR